MSTAAGSMTKNQKKISSPAAASSSDSKTTRSSDNEIVFPGDTLTIDDDDDNDDGGTRIGVGLLQQRDGDLTVSKCGVLRRDDKRRGVDVRVQNYQRPYIPQINDLVIGTVIEKHFEQYRVDIGTKLPTTLPTIAFEGATKRNRPNIKVGAVVYCRVATANKHMDTGLVCTSPHFKKEWVTGESLFGELPDGYVFDVSLRLAHALLDPDCVVLASVGAFIPFEIAVGSNGRVWLNAATRRHIVLVSNAVLNSEHMSDAKIRAMTNRMKQHVEQ